MVNTRLSKDNYDQHDIKKALSVRAIKVSFNDESDQHQFEIACHMINCKIRSAIEGTYKKYKDKVKELKAERKQSSTPKKEKRKITTVLRCVKYGKSFKQKKNGYEHYANFKDQLEFIYAVLLQAHSFNKMVWLNRNKVYYYDKNLNRYFSFIFDHESLCISFDILVHYGYLDEIEFEEGSKKKKGRCTRYILSGILKVFDELPDNYSFTYDNMKETVILKNEVTTLEIEKDKNDKIIKYKNGNPKRTESKKKTMVNYKDTKFTNNRREFIERYNNDLSNRKITINAKNVFLKKTFSPKLISMILNNKIMLSSLKINNYVDQNYLLIMNKYKIKNIKDLLFISEDYVSENQYKYILSKKIAVYNICYYNSDEHDGYIFFKELNFEILDKDIRSIFNRGNPEEPEEFFTKGGRFYDQIVQSLPKALRKFIYLDGEPCVSGDYKALHINLAYNDSNKVCPHADPYEIDGTNRDEIKLASLIAINATSLNDAVWATQSKIKKQLSREVTEEHADCLVEKFAEHNLDIVDCIGNDTGVALQFYDSVIMQDALEQLMDLGICGLPVHDEIIVPEQHIETAKQIMIEAYRNQSFTNGFKPTVTISKKPPIKAQILLEVELYRARILTTTNSRKSLKTAHINSFTTHSNIADIGKYWKLDLAA